MHGGASTIATLRWLRSGGRAGAKRESSAGRPAKRSARGIFPDSVAGVRGASHALGKLDCREDLALQGGPGVGAFMPSRRILEAQARPVRLTIETARAPLK